MSAPFTNAGFTTSTSTSYTISTGAYVSPQSAWAWGGNTTGVLGNGSTATAVSSPSVVHGPWTMISAGPRASAGIRSGDLYTWGSDANGQQGNGATTGLVLSPTAISSTGDWLTAGSGGDHMCGIRKASAGATAGTLWCWGLNDDGQVGTGNVAVSPTVPTQIGAFNDWTTLSIGDSSSFGLRGGALYAWGYNTNGQLGRGAGNTTNVSAPTQIGAATDWRYLGMGYANFCGIKAAAGELWCAGSNGNGQLGQSNTTGMPGVLVQVTVPAATGWTAVGTGFWSAGINAGRLYTWGLNADGQLGLGNTTSPVTTPTQVGSATDWTQIANGPLYSMLALRGTSLYGWGRNAQGQLGQGNTASPVTSPVQILTGVSAVSGRGYAAFALASTCSSSTPLWMTGMEHGVADTTASALGVFATKSGTWTADASVKRSGAYSMKFVDASGASAGWAKSTAFTATNVATARFAVRLATLPATVTELFTVKDASNTRLAGIEFNPTGNKTQGKVDTTTTLGTTVLSAATWYVIDVKVDLSATSNKVDWRVNGVAQPQATKSASVRTFTGVQLGSQLNTEQFTANFDDVLVTGSLADYPLPDGEILGLSPDAISAITNPTSYLKDNATATNISSTSWSLIDDVPMTTTTDYIRQTTASTGHYADVGFPDVTSSTCINGVRAVLTMRSSGDGTGTNQAKSSVFRGATETVIHNDDVSPGNATKEYRGGVVPNPADGWSIGDVNGLEARIGAAANTGEQPYWDSVMLEYDRSL